ncbi:MAG: hypothetical protein ACLPHP_07335 [Candidatus Sulfotelmatobacter sp.]
MKSLHLVLAVALMSLSAVALAQSDAQKSFDQMKTLAGSWEGVLKTFPPTPEVDGKHAQTTLRVTSMGNALMHEMRIEGRADDPITMFYMNDDRLTLTHYCDAGNRPRMTAKASPDGKTVEFEFLDVAGSTQYGHMHHALFTFIDANHHTEDWTFMVGDKPVQAHFELQRTK